MNPFDAAAIVGAFESPRRKCNDEHPFQLFQEVICGALDDAGLSLADVDGLCVTAGDSGEGSTTEDVIEIAEYVGIRPTYFESTDVGGCSAFPGAFSVARFAEWRQHVLWGFFPDERS
jgi:hypothetical protein